MLYYLLIKIFYVLLLLLLLLLLLMCTCEQHTYTSSEHLNFHLEEGETMLARGNENFRAPCENRTRDLPNPVIPGKQTGTSWGEF